MESVSDVCRLCEATDNLMWIFDRRLDYQNTDTRDMIFLMTKVQISIKDVVSQKICKNCHQDCKDFMDFKRTSLANTFSLKNRCADLLNKSNVGANISNRNISNSERKRKLNERSERESNQIKRPCFNNPVKHHLQLGSPIVSVNSSEHQTLNEQLIPKIMEEVARNGGFLEPSKAAPKLFAKYGNKTDFWLKVGTPVVNLALDSSIISKSHDALQFIGESSLKQLQTKVRSVSNPYRKIKIDNVSPSENPQKHLKHYYAETPDDGTNDTSYHNKSKLPNPFDIHETREYIANSGIENKQKHILCQFCKSRFRSMDLKNLHIKNSCRVKIMMKNLPFIKLEKIEGRRKYSKAIASWPPLKSKSGNEYFKRKKSKPKTSNFHKEHTDGSIRNSSNVIEVTSSNKNGCSVRDASTTCGPLFCYANTEIGEMAVEETLIPTIENASTVDSDMKDVSKSPRIIETSSHIQNNPPDQRSVIPTAVSEPFQGFPKKYICPTMYRVPSSQETSEISDALASTAVKSEIPSEDFSIQYALNRSDRYVPITEDISSDETSISSIEFEVMDGSLKKNLPSGVAQIQSDIQYSVTTGNADTAANIVKPETQIEAIPTPNTAGQTDRYVSTIGNLPDDKISRPESAPRAVGSNSPVIYVAPAVCKASDFSELFHRCPDKNASHGLMKADEVNFVSSIKNEAVIEIDEKTSSLPESSTFIDIQPNFEEQICSTRSIAPDIFGAPAVCEASDVSELFHRFSEKNASHAASKSAVDKIFESPPDEENPLPSFESVGAIAASKDRNICSPENKSPISKLHSTIGRIDAKADEANFISSIKIEAVVEIDEKTSSFPESSTIIDILPDFEEQISSTSIAPEIFEASAVCEASDESELFHRFPERNASHAASKSAVEKIFKNPPDEENPLPSSVSFGVIAAFEGSPDRNACSPEIMSPISKLHSTIGRIDAKADEANFISSIKIEAVVEIDEKTSSFPESSTIIDILPDLEEQICSTKSIAPEISGAPDVCEASDVSEIFHRFPEKNASHAASESAVDKIFENLPDEENPLPSSVSFGAIAASKGSSDRNTCSPEIISPISKPHSTIERIDAKADEANFISSIKSEAIIEIDEKTSFSESSTMTTIIDILPDFGEQDYPTRSIAPAIFGPASSDNIRTESDEVTTAKNPKDNIVKLKKVSNLIFSSSHVKPVINISNEDLLKLKLCLSRQTFTQTDLPLNASIVESTGFNVKLKNLKHHAFAYKIPVYISKGDFQVSYHYGIHREPKKKLDLWNDLSPVDVIAPGCVGNRSFSINSPPANGQALSELNRNHDIIVPTHRRFSPAPGMTYYHPLCGLIANINGIDSYCDYVDYSLTKAGISAMSSENVPGQQPSNFPFSYSTTLIDHRERYSTNVGFLRTLRE